MSANLIALQNRFLGRGNTVYDRLATLREAKGRALNDDELGALARELNLPAAHVRSVALFYDELKPGSPVQRRLRVCNGEACAVAGGEPCKQQLEEALAGVDDLEIGEVTCVGYCGQGPNALFEHGNDASVFSLRGESARETLVEALRSGSGAPLDEPANAIYKASGAANVLLRYADEAQHELVVARNNGAYRALETALQAAPAAIIESIDASRIRGRGGAGFPAGRKLQTVAKALAPDGKRYVVCNADEGDAGAYIDKELMERDPHAVLEGMALAAYAVGADEGYVYLRAEYPRARRRMKQALAEANEANLLGDSILESDFSFQVHLVMGHGAYICGEETSLLRSLEGVPAQVSPKPPYPAIEGLRGAPTVVNNVESLAAFPWIVRHGGETYAALGSADSRGTKLVSLNTAVARPGLYEVELGTTLRTLIFDLAGGMAGGKRFKAVQVGGPLGGIFSEPHLDLPLEFEALAEAGGMLGHAGLVVFPHDVDMVQIGRGLMKFCAVESCGKCFPCRIGSVRGTELFDKILDGRGTQADLDLLAELNETMRLGSLCALGGAVPMPMDSLLVHFIDDFRKHIPGATTPASLPGAQNSKGGQSSKGKVSRS